MDENWSMNLSISRLSLLLLLSVVGVILWLPTAEGQIVSDPHFRGDKNLRTSELLRLPTSRLSAFDQDSARVAMEQYSEGLRSYVFAHTIPHEVDIIKAGEYSRAKDGSQVWKYRVRSAGAKSLSFFFDQFVLPEGALLYIYNTLNQEQYLGGYGAQNNNPERSLPTQLILAEDVVIELHAPAGTTPMLRLAEVHHGVRSLAHLRYSSPQYGGDFQEYLTCTPELICYPEYLGEGQSVVLVLSGGTALGTGTLINNTKGDGRPLILTAAHVISVNFTKSDVYEQAAKSVVYFNYRSSTCSGEVRPQITQTIAGASIIGYHEYTDGGLLELNHKPPMDYQPTYAGWNASEAHRGPYFNIHHPRGLTKRINFCVRALQQVTFPDLGLPFGELQHMQVNGWDVGTTEGGSSGSPLFDEHKRVIGFLTGGRSTCKSKSADQFGVLKNVWASDDIEAQKIVRALDPSGGKSLTCEPLSTVSSSNIVRITNVTAPRGNEQITETMPQLPPSQILGTSIGATEVLESYRLRGGTKIYGVYLMVSGVPETPSDIEVTIYDATGSQALGKINIPTASIEEGVKSDHTTQVSELYASMDQPLTLVADGIVHFGVKVSSIPNGLSIIHQQHKEEQRNTCYWRINHKLEPLYQRGDIRASMWLDPLVSDSQLVPTDLETPRIRITPASADDVMITLGDGLAPDSKSRLEVFTLLGQRLYATDIVGRHHIFSRNMLEGAGVMIMRVQTEEWEESLKVYFPTF